MTGKNGMTKAQALAEAKRRWGQSGTVKIDTSYPTGPYIVGRYVGGWFFIECMGPTWEAAFVGADRIKRLGSAN